MNSKTSPTHQGWYNSAEWAPSFCSADTRANYKDLSALQSDLPLGLCECPVTSVPSLYIQ